MCVFMAEVATTGREGRVINYKACISVVHGIASSQAGQATFVGVHINTVASPNEPLSTATHQMA